MPVTLPEQYDEDVSILSSSRLPGISRSDAIKASSSVQECDVSDTENHRISSVRQIHRKNPIPPMNQISCENQIPDRNLIHNEKTTRNQQIPRKNQVTYKNKLPNGDQIPKNMTGGISDPEENKQKVSDFDDLINLLGLGRWTLLMVAPYLCWALVLPYFSLGGAFLNPMVDHWCASSPSAWEKQDGQIINSPCQTYDWQAMKNSTEFSHLTPAVLETGNWTAELDKIPKKQCNAWEYDTSVFKSTVTTEFDLVCASAALSPFFQSFYYFGTTIGEPLLGYLSDKLGRRWVLMRVWVLFVFASVTSVMATSYPLLLGMRLLLGIVHSAGSVAYVLVLETSPTRVRSVFGLAFTTVYAFTGIAFGGLAYFFREWRTLQAICILPGLLHLIYLFFLDESPRWLLQSGEVTRARQVLEGAAVLQSVTLPPADDLQRLLVRQQKEIQAENPSVAKDEGCFQSIKEILKLWLREFLSLLRTPVLRRISFAMFGCWFVVGLSYWGMSLAGGSFSSDPFLYMSLSSLMEVPGYVWIIPLVSHLGRRVVLTINFVVCACAMLLIPLIPSENIWVIFSLAMVGKLFITGAYNLLYLYSVELFPTCVRNRGLSVSSMMARVASISAPFVTKSLASSYESAPSLVFGAAAACGALLSFLLPESKGKPLLDSVEQLEQTYGKKTGQNTDGKPAKKSSMAEQGVENTLLYNED
ncbi:Major facilitator sugar transporter-like [Trinorchestia longiramus]|nr:Major facilitator sugar transporter-like [Trinorchestia longiramus]